jgi:hypothetical protein
MTVEPVTLDSITAYGRPTPYDEKKTIHRLAR